MSVKTMPELKVSDYRVLMLGPVGSGKSSFFNTIYSVFKDRISQKARSGNTTHSITTAVSQTFWFHVKPSMIITCIDLDRIKFITHQQ